MKHIFVRPAREADLKTLVEWSGGNPAFDPEIFKYATTYTLAAFDHAAVIAYAPIQQPLMIDAIGFHPAANDFEKAAAMKEITHTVITQAYQSNRGEIYFLGSDQGTNLFAGNHGFKRVDWPVYRVRLVDLERGGGNGSAT